MDEREKLSCTSSTEKIQSNSIQTDNDDLEEQSLFIDENMKLSDSIPFIEEVVVENNEISLSNSSNNHSDDEEEEDDQLSEIEVNLQEDYALPEFPADLKLVVEQKNLTKLAPHSYFRKMLLSLIYDDIANKHNLL